MSIFAMCVVDAYILMTGCRGTNSGFENSREFFQKLAEELIDNTFDQRALRKRAERHAASRDPLRRLSTNTSLSPSKQMIAVTPTKRYKKKNLKHRHQGRCQSCGSMTVYVCRACQKYQPDTRSKQYWICNRPGQTCMGDHIVKRHPEFVKGDSDSE
jgi:hypothetical protein